MIAKLFIILLFTYLITLNSSFTIRNEGPSEMAITASQTIFSDGYVPFLDVNVAYKIFERPTSWTDARDRCIADDAKLAIADSYQKISHINSIKTSSGKWLSVGIHKLKGTDRWVRADNDLPVTSVPWNSNNPDGAGDCAGISLFGKGLVDYPCDWAGEYFVCEKPIR